MKIAINAVMATGAEAICARLLFGRGLSSTAKNRFIPGFDLLLT
jgi:hypothetical protein